mmetsp:Transcript_31749/g.94551  ORF Transcript_31749/g.94551 Transcript_31749/m.94551 type:complete len:365 (+) Transcript_31749:1308-2402(+)
MIVLKGLDRRLLLKGEHVLTAIPSGVALLDVALGEAVDLPLSQLRVEHVHCLPEEGCRDLTRLVRKVDLEQLPFAARVVESADVGLRDDARLDPPPAVCVRRDLRDWQEAALCAALRLARHWLTAKEVIDGAGTSTVCCTGAAGIRTVRRPWSCPDPAIAILWWKAADRSTRSSVWIGSLSSCSSHSHGLGHWRLVGDAPVRTPLGRCESTRGLRSSSSPWRQHCRLGLRLGHLRRLHLRLSRGCCCGVCLCGLHAGSCPVAHELPQALHWCSQVRRDHAHDLCLHDQEEGRAVKVFQAVLHDLDESVDHHYPRLDLLDEAGSGYGQCLDNKLTVRDRDRVPRLCILLQLPDILHLQEQLEVAW